MSSTNPVLGMSVYSHMNALELYQTNDERHRFGAIILMDLSVEYILKAKPYELNPSEFMEKGEDLGFTNVMDDSRIVLADDERKQLTRVHSVRNYAQHRGTIPDSLGTAQYMNWLCMFVKRFSTDNNFHIRLPPNLNRTWIELTALKEKGDESKPFVLNMPIEENYRTARNWIRYREQNSKRGSLYPNYRHQLLYHLRKFCQFVKRTPDELIEDSENGYSYDHELKEYLDTLSTPSPIWIAIKSFFEYHKITINLRMPHYKPMNLASEITTDQIRKICDVADLENKSWILATSYMGLNVGEIVKIRVADFRTENWSIPKQIYPVKIRKEVSNTFDYTTFIGEDAKKLLELYFLEQKFSPQDQPWGHINSSSLSWNFRGYAYETKLYGRGSQYKLTPKTLIKRLKNTLTATGMRYEWVCYVLGAKPKGIESDRPLDEELTKAYEKAYPKLKIFDLSEILDLQSRIERNTRENDSQQKLL